MQLDAKLSDQKQNLVFARNGSGKSFVSRALRALDVDELPQEQKDNIPERLVSAESRDGQGSFGLYENDICIGGLGLNKDTNTVSLTQPKYIFHVFSEDFVDTHVRNKFDDLGGNISHEIIVGKDNADLDAKEAEQKNKGDAYDQELDDLAKLFNEEKGKLQTDFAINRQLGAFKNLNADLYFADTPYDADEDELNEFLDQYNKFKSLPSDPDLPSDLIFTGLGLALDEIDQALQKMTSPSSVAEEFKVKINADLDFYKTGLGIYDLNPDECPFCTQDMASVAIEAIERYQSYFNNAEAKEQEKLRDFADQIQEAKRAIQQWETKFLKEKNRFDQLKQFFPSLVEKEVKDAGSYAVSIFTYLENLEQAIQQKLPNLTVSSAMPTGDLNALQTALSGVFSDNNRLCSDLAGLVDSSSNERKGIQNNACAAFRDGFFKEHEGSIEETRELAADLETLKVEIAELKKTHGETADARARVVDTFSLLLRQFFGEKYSFDGDAFSVRHKNLKMERGADRTLSDGEKSAMAFCYFIARTHLRVESNDDYQNVFFIIDDPVSSMSFDYVYAIAQCLKQLRISADGEIKFVQEGNVTRPRMLILTHNTYFYNVVASNGVVKPSGLFQLVSGPDSHSLSCQNKVASPHSLQLKDVFAIAEGNKSPDHTTANSIRSVIESMYKFCRPDLADAGGFIEYLMRGFNFKIKSILINGLSHGGKFSDPPHKEEDLVDAAKEAIKVVEKFTVGQIKNLRT
ncbi:MAG: AAA family ATPase [Marinosulfonomonas sp.]|nr:AAA family ATPase [Marinosulfonomonas sp.]